MDIADLPYLQRIAKALKRLTGSSGTTTTGSTTASKTSIRAGGTVKTDEINENLHLGLITTVTEEEGGETVEVEKSVYDVMGDEMVQLLHDALHITVTEEQGGVPVEVEKKAFEVIRDDLAAMKVEPTENENETP